ncbi:MAG: hypothetical protein J6C01_04410 [Lachnospiraceae bacterium]|nr:hypothetical protein [Lachnospiraceae bacterium]
MIKLLNKKKKVHNQGNTYIMVVATLSFLAVLVAAMLVAVALCYRLKAYDINARDNFYYLEQAMDEIYAGVGADSMKHLNTAYDDTIEVLVYFDAKTQSYVTMDDDAANKILKNTFMYLVQNDTRYNNVTNLESHLKTFLSNKYSSTNKEGILLSVEKVDASSSTEQLTIVNLVLKREAIYSTVNTRKANNDTVDVPAGDKFVQTITTDLVIGKPEFNVKFNTIKSNLSDLYDFAFVADQGIEIGNATSKVNITGNIYAAADFYNKDYNKAAKEDGAINKTGKDSIDGLEKSVKYAKVSSYDDKDARYLSANGKNEKSMYSGLYINGADVFISADKIIVPGSIAAFNGSNLTVFGTGDTTYARADIWADGIVLGGYSFLVDPSDTKNKDVQGSVVNLRANAYIYDDLEINAHSSEFLLAGDYYGYNYASIDNRVYTDECLKAYGQRTFVTKADDELKDATSLNGQAHYNSSAIIVNGENSSLDLSNVNNMYIAGQAYIETSKTKKESNKVVDANGKETDYTVKNKNDEDEVVTYTTVDYLGKDDDNYTTNTDDFEAKKDSTNIQDYRTGEAISIKSNQLAYVAIPSWMVDDTKEGLFISLADSEKVKNLDLFQKYFDDISKIPVIKTVVSGKPYYFFDFSKTAEYNPDPNKDGNTDDATGISGGVMNTFLEEYAKLFATEDSANIAEAAGLVDITDYDYFKIKLLSFDVSQDSKGNYLTDGQPATNVAGDYQNIYSNSAISIKQGTDFTLKAKSSSISPLLTVAEQLNNNITEQNKYIADNKDKRKDSIAIPQNSNSIFTSAQAETLATDVTTKLQSQYQEVKWTLSTTSSDAKAVQASHSMEESDITPINYFFDFNKIDDAVTKKLGDGYQLKSGYKVWVSNKDVNVTTAGFADGNVKGLVICKGDVTFDSGVKSFEGLIVSGSKVRITHSMNFTANEEVIKTILRECDESQQDTSTKFLFDVCELFQHYKTFYKSDTSSGTAVTESTKSISAVQFEDILSFNNWKKNVD